MPRNIVRSTDAIPVRPLEITIYGPPGSGKTTICQTAPRPMTYDWDGGIARAVQAYRQDADRLEDGFEAFYDYLMSQEFLDDMRVGGYQTAIMDTAGKLLDDYMTPYIMQNERFRYGNSLNQKGWGEMKSMFRLMRNRYKEAGLHIIYIAHEREEEDKASRIQVSGGSMAIIESSSDLMGYLSIDSSGNRILNFNPTLTHRGKNTGQFPILTIPNVLKKPEALVGYMGKIIAQTQKVMTEQTDAQKKAAEKIVAYREAIDKAFEPEEYKKIILDLRGEDAIIAKQLLPLLMAALKESGLKYTKETDTVEAREPVPVSKEAKVAADTEKNDAAVEATVEAVEAQGEPLTAARGIITITEAREGNPDENDDAQEQE